MLTISSARTRATPEPDATVLLKEPDVQGDRACAWVISRGFDPVHLCVEVQSMRNPKITSTALYEACVLGEFDIAKWIFAHGGAASIRIKDNLAQCPMYVACREGHLDIAKWLHAVGAAADIRTPDVCGATPLYCTAWRGHLKVAKWLYEMGAANDVTTRTVSFNFPLQTAARNGHLDVMEWLVEAGAGDDIVASDARGVTPLIEAWRRALKSTAATTMAKHCRVTCWLLERGAAAEAGMFQRDVLAHVTFGLDVHHLGDGGALRELGSMLAGRLAAHASVAMLLLAVARLRRKGGNKAGGQGSKVGASGGAAGDGAGGDAGGDAGAGAAAAAARCALRRLRGLEGSVLRLVADFVGAPRGAALRYLREAHRATEAALGQYQGEL